MSEARCDRCGSYLSRYTDGPLCAPCSSTTQADAGGDVRPWEPPTDSAWLWTSATADAVLATRDLAQILRAYRRTNNISQRQLADRLGFDPSYVSMLERGTRTLSDRVTLSRIAEQLGIPPHALGVTDLADADHRAMLQFAASTIRLAEISRHAGNALQAANELWPLIARLEARLAEGFIERDVAFLLARARIAFGTCLGNVLPEEKLALAARWTGKGLRVAQRLDDPPLNAYALRMHGNELRKAGRPAAAVARLRHAVSLADHPVERGAALTLLARASGDHGDGTLFNATIADLQRALDATTEHTSLFNAFTAREVHIRGLLATGQDDRALRLALTWETKPTVLAPQWTVIEHITMSEALLRTGEHDDAYQLLQATISEAERNRLPHQLQRIIALATPDLAEIVADATGALRRLNETLTLPGTVEAS